MYSKIFCFLIIALLWTACTEDNPEPVFFTAPEEVFDLEAVPIVKLTVNLDEWNTLLTNFDKNPRNEIYVKCNFEFTKNGRTKTLENCGIKIRGNTSRRRPEGNPDELHNSVDPDWHHASFSVDFNRNHPKQEFSGLKRLNLKWFKDDAMYVREIYCYDLFRRFQVWTAPRSSYCKLQIQVNNETAAYFGIYELLEAVDYRFIENRLPFFGDDQGFLWKCNWGSDLVNGARNRMDIEEADLDHTFRPVYDFKGDSSRLEIARDALVLFIDSLNHRKAGDFRTWFSKTVDVDLLLRTYAVNILCGMWDDYWINKNNYYIYLNSQGKFFFIPFDYDNTLGTSQIIADAGRRDPLHWGNDSYPLIKRILTIPGGEENLFIQHFHTLCDPELDLFDPLKSMSRIRNWQMMIQNDIVNDTGEDNEIMDIPANWGNCDFYRLLDTENNYFTIRSSNIPSLN